MTCIPQQILFLAIVFSFKNVYANGWTQPSLLTKSSSNRFKVGETELTLGSNYETNSWQYSAAGEKTRIFNIYKNETSEDEASNSHSQTQIQKLTFLAQAETTLNRFLILGAQLPVHLIKYEKDNIESGERSESDATQIGDVEFISKELIFARQKQKLILIQRLIFPSSERSNVEQEAEFIKMKSGYEFSFGANWALSHTGAFYSEAMVAYNLTFEDGIKDLESDKTVSRDPGDEIVTKIASGYQFNSLFSTEIGMLYSYRQKDQFSENEETLSSYTQYSWQNLGILNFKYKLQPADSRDSDIYVKLQMQKSISGKGTQDTNSVGFFISSSI